MRGNPFREAVKIEQLILNLQTKLLNYERDAKLLVEKLKNIDLAHRKFKGFQDQLRGTERAITKTRAKLRDAISAKRKKEQLGEKALYGNRKNEIIWRDTHREISQELRVQETLLESLKGKEVLLQKKPRELTPKFDLFISHASEDKDHSDQCAREAGNRTEPRRIQFRRPKRPGRHLLRIQFT